MNSNAMES
jgi:predicted  nucleic acid-binding Zn-ribbon protein